MQARFLICSVINTNFEVKKDKCAQEQKKNILKLFNVLFLIFKETLIIFKY